jgi:hypothetical protein
MEIAELTIRPPSGVLGQRFGRLVVEAMTNQYSGTGRLYECRCDCGNMALVVKSALQNKLLKARTVSCGCQRRAKAKKLGDSHFRSLVGRKFGRLQVINVANAPSDNSRGAMYICWCDCGQVKNVRAMELRSGDTKSCGCLMREKFSGVKTPLA